MNKYLIVEIANNPLALAKGLMGRTDMPSDHGMLFKFPSVTNASFWGKDTYIPLDIAFVNKDNKICSIKHIVPMSTRMVHSGSDYAMAIEANQGFFKNHDIKEGHAVEIEEDTDKVRIVFKNAQDN